MGVFNARKVKMGWGLVLGGSGDLNDLREHAEKRGGRRRPDSSFRNFGSFIHYMKMEEIRSVRSAYTWANNRAGEGFVEEKLDRFFGTTSWVVQHPRSKIMHVEKQTSDHCLLILDTELECNKLKRRFCFWSKMAAMEGDWWGGWESMEGRAAGYFNVSGVL